MAPSALPPDIDRMFAEGGAAGALMREVDWAATPIGAPGHWPQSLRTALSVCLSSRFPMLIWWGPELVMLYNDAYSPMPGTKHPNSMGQRGQDCWPEIWDFIGPMLDGVLAGDGATLSEDQQLLLVRHGFVEECYFTFSYSPISDETAGVGGVFSAISETTGRVIGERRLATLRALGQELIGAKSPESALRKATRVLDGARADVPFTLAYLLGDDGTPTRVASAGGLTGEALAAAESAVGDALGYVDKVTLGSPVTLDVLTASAPIEQALVLPAEAPGATARLVVGLSPLLALDEDYRSFLTLTAGQVAAGLSDAVAYQTERARAEALAALDEAKTTFFANISHEFRTPLTLMLGPIEDALADPEGPLPEAQLSRVELVRRNAVRLLKLVNTLLDFSRLESGRVTASYEPVDIGPYTSSLASMFRSAVERAGLEFTVDCPPLRDPVFVDREMWEKIVLNLLSNALKFTFDGSIAIRTRGRDGGVALTVTDTGTGVETDQQSQLFDRFHRVHGARSRTFEGSGIGLALVRDLVSLHGGAVAVDSTPGQGSTFTVTLPSGAGHLPPDKVVAEAADTVEPGDQAAAFVGEALRWLDPTDRDDPTTGGTKTAGGSRATRPRVLFADDNADMRDYVIGLLRGSYTVHAAADGMAALEMARADPPDLVLADVMMPRLDGLGLLSALRADPATERLPVILVSARAGEESAVEGLDAGADDYLVKPFAARELLARVRGHLELDRARRRTDDLRHYRGLLDKAQRLAQVGSWELDLATEVVTGSDEFLRQLQLRADELAELGLRGGIAQLVHPDDQETVYAAIQGALVGEPMDIEVRLVRADGEVRTCRTIGEVERDADGKPVLLRGSQQDITEQRAAQRAVTAAEAAQKAAGLEHRIADELQWSLLPEPSFDPDHLEVATLYRPGIAGTQVVGGDWYDLIDLGAGRTALVIGDVMGRGVKAAAVMGQLRAAIRGYARLDLPPADVLGLLDGVVRDLGRDQIVTCVYAIYDPAERVLTYANAGHLPPLVKSMDGTVVLPEHDAAPPLGTGVTVPAERRIAMAAGMTLALYTDGLVETRDRDVEAGVDQLRAAMTALDDHPLDSLPLRLAEKLDTGEQDDDVAVLAVRVRQDELTVPVTLTVDGRSEAVAEARRFAAATASTWSVPSRVEDIVLVVSELVTNAVLHARPPIQVTMHRTRAAVVVEVRDRSRSLPRQLRASVEDEHGRGLQIVAQVADRWGARSTRTGKATWCVVHFDGRRT